LAQRPGLFAGACASLTAEVFLRKDAPARWARSFASTSPCNRQQSPAPGGAKESLNVSRRRLRVVSETVTPGVQDGTDILRMAEFDGSSIQCGHPHLLVWRAMGTDNCQIAKRACQPVHFVHVYQFQVEHGHARFMARQ